MAVGSTQSLTETSKTNISWYSFLLLFHVGYISCKLPAISLVGTC